jgi:hypothetical protein
MRTKRPGRSNLIEGGKETFENTDEFNRKVQQIKKDVRDQYSLSLSHERNWAKRILIIIRRELEIRRRIAALSSLKNLHTAHPAWYM